MSVRILQLAAVLFVLGGSVSGGAQTHCSTVYPLRLGWAIDTCATDPAVSQPMQVLVDGVSVGSAVIVRIYHQAEGFAGVPQVAAFYSNGFVRLKQNADPDPPIPFGGSFILGPAYWSGAYYHNPS